MSCGPRARLVPEPAGGAGRRSTARPARPALIGQQRRGGRGGARQSHAAARRHRGVVRLCWSRDAPAGLPLLAPPAWRWKWGLRAGRLRVRARRPSVKPAARVGGKRRRFSGERFLSSRSPKGWRQKSGSASPGGWPRGAPPRRLQNASRQLAGLERARGRVSGSNSGEGRNLPPQFGCLSPLPPLQSSPAVCCPPDPKFCPSLGPVPLSLERDIGSW